MGKKLKGPIVWAQDPDCIGGRAKVRVLSVDRERKVAKVLKSNGSEAYLPLSWLYKASKKAA